MNENEVSSAVIGAAIDVHKELGPGLVEKIYEEALCHELHLRGLKFLRQRSVPISYKGVSLSVPLWLDLLVEHIVIIDLKAKEQVQLWTRPNCVVISASREFISASSLISTLSASSMESPAS